MPGRGGSARYLGGEASEEESAGIRRHLAVCGGCDLLLERMRAFDQATRPKRVLEWLRSPAFAYALVALLLYPAYRGVFGGRQAAEEKPALVAESAQILDLSPERGLEVQATPDARDKVFILSFFVPVRAGARYFAEITDAGGKAVVARRELSGHDSAGNSHLVCARDLFRAGRYTLTVTESGSGRQFPFPFTI